MKDFSSLSKVEQQAFPGAQITYSEPPQIQRTDIVWMTAKDHEGDWICGVFAPGDPDNDLCVIHFYGNKENLHSTEYVIQRLREKGVSVLMFDYRGYGASRGRPRESAFYADAELAYDWLRERHPDLRVVASGWFMGSAVATYLAQVRDMAGLMLFSSPTNMLEVVSHVFPKDQVIIEEAMPFRFDSLERIRKVRCPILLVHGKQDTVVPYEMSRRLEAGVRSPFYRLDLSAAGHEDLFTTGGDQLWERVYEFLDSLAGASEEGD
jgi:fermentation-respiration switch protein FrsA (DUF1100 family)